MLLLSDAEKASDRDAWTLLEQTLSYTGFNDTFIKWIQIFNKTLRSRVRVNGYCSDLFPLGCGTHQGDMLSPSLFAQSTEPPAALMRTNALTVGIFDEGKDRHILALFTVDILLLLEKCHYLCPFHSLNEY